MKSIFFLEKQDKCTEYPDFLYDTRLDRGSFYFYNTCIKFNLWKFHFDMINFHQPAWYSHFNEISKLLKNWRLWIFAFRVGVFFMGSFQIILINEQMQITKFPWNHTNVPNENKISLTCRSNYLSLLNEANEFPISSHVWVAPSTFRQL